MRSKNDIAAALQVYELVGFVAEIKAHEDRGSHMVSFINVTLSSPLRHDGDASWHLFNDFLVAPVSKDEALNFAPKWKMPSVVFFQLKSEKNVVDNAWQDHIQTWILYADFAYMGKARKEETTVRLSQDEEPCKGTIVSLDAEFVSLQKEETEVKADGTKSMVRPERNGLARVSVLRGRGLNEGVPFLDDYINIKEPVLNYLTEFSGIYPGDLDPNRSKHAVVSLKVAYKRLWILLNLGCIFVGHGLLKDFRIISRSCRTVCVVHRTDLRRYTRSQGTGSGYG